MFADKVLSIRSGLGHSGAFSQMDHFFITKDLNFRFCLSPVPTNLHLNRDHKTSISRLKRDPHLGHSFFQQLVTVLGVLYEDCVVNLSQ